MATSLLEDLKTWPKGKTLDTKQTPEQQEHPIKSNGSSPIGSPCSDGTTAGTVDGSRGLRITGWEPDVGDVNCPPLATLSSSVSGSLYLPSAPGEDSEMTLAGLEGGAGL